MNGIGSIAKIQSKFFRAAAAPARSLKINRTWKGTPSGNIDFSRSIAGREGALSRTLSRAKAL